MLCPLPIFSREYQSVIKNRKKSAKNLEKQAVLKRSLPPISGGTRIILIPHIVADKQNLKKSYTREVHREKPAHFSGKIFLHPNCSPL